MKYLFLLLFLVGCGEVTQSFYIGQCVIHTAESVSRARKAYNCSLRGEVTEYILNADFYNVEFKCVNNKTLTVENTPPSYLRSCE